MRRADKVILLLAALVIVGSVFLATSCAPGTVDTSAGRTDPAAVVQAQDAVGDALKLLDQFYADTVAAHNAKPAPDAAEKAVLDDERAALVTAWANLKAWKMGAPFTVSTVMADVARATPALLDLGVRVGLFSQATADKIRAVLQGIGVFLPKPSAALRVVPLAEAA
jgi:hypothetical protein